MGNHVQRGGEMNLKSMPILVLLIALMLVLVACGEDSLPYRNEGDDLSTIGYYQEAIEQYDEAIRIDPQDANTYNGRGLAYGGLGQYERAIQDYDEAIRLNPQDADAYYNRGAAYNALGKSREAERDFAKAKELDGPP